ncbi:MAG: Killer protein [Gammaproteobacteria bacterium]|jgi:toxin HigB-1|nr:Killer protein [Gammaproteobacteria bacterium]MBT5250200.1 Killer protein [Bacteroidetes Order II. bacterium]
MIKDFKHKGLEKFFTAGSTRGIQAQHSNKLRMQLAMLDASIEVDDMNKPGWNLHQLKGRKAGIWSIKVSGNWRLTFAFEDGDAYIVNYEDYH